MNKLILLALTTVLTTALHAEVNIGDAEEKVLKELGSPKSRIVIGSKLELLYPNKVLVRFENGRVKEIEHKENIGKPVPPPAAKAAPGKETAPKTPAKPPAKETVPAPKPAPGKTPQAPTDKK
jgi:hypothetical protein